MKNRKDFLWVAVLVGILSLALAGCGGGSKAPSGSGQQAAGEKYPVKPVEFIVPWGPGGGADQTARTSAPQVEKALGVSLPVVNVAGATGATGLTKLLAAGADGHSIAIYTADSHAVLATSDKPAWKLEDLAPVARMIKAPSFLFVKADGKYKNWADFEKAAKENPGKIKVGITGQGSPDDMTVQFLASKGIKLQGVPFPNPSERYVSVIGGHVDALYEQAGDVRQYIDGKQMTPIIIFNETRFEAFKDVPCSKELGYDIFLPQTRSVVAKAGTDPKKIKVLADAFKKAYDTPEYQKWLEQQYGTKDSYMGPEDASKFLKADLENMKALLPKK
ncbi:MAG: tripartite tricarboxylate transporter substrate binding protein [Desulfocucumaceae bacterium]